MRRLASLSIIQSVLTSSLIPVYILCAHNKFLWFEVFYNFATRSSSIYSTNSTKTCSRSIIWQEKDKPCDLYNGVYTILNCFICLASLIASIELATNGRTSNIQTRKNILLAWLIVNMIFILHLVLLHFLTINSILIKLRSSAGNERFEIIISSLVLMIFTIPMIVTSVFFVMGFHHVIKLHIRLNINGHWDLRDQIEERIRADIEWTSERKKRRRQVEIEPIKRLSLAIVGSHCNNMNFESYK